MKLLLVLPLVIFFGINTFAQNCPIVPPPQYNSSIAFCQDEIAVSLSKSAEGPNLLWYTQPTGGTGTPVAPLPSTAVPGITPYYVSSSNGNGCESIRVKIDAIVYDICYYAALQNRTQALAVSGPVSFSSNCDNLITRIVPGGVAPLAGNTTATVWFDDVQQPGYLKRHYQITPENNATVATARISLYFKQTEFDAFNAVNPVKLPTGPDDAAGISRLVLQKRGGVSIDGSGLPASFPGPITIIDPDDNDIFYDYVSYRWQVSFDVTGFSGFFAGSFASLPVKWLQLSADLNNVGNASLNWKVQESGVESYTVEQSDNGLQFNKMGTLLSKGDGEHSYTFNDTKKLFHKQFYRITQKDKDGKFTFSAVLTLVPVSSGVIVVYPNPVRQSIRLEVPKSLGYSLMKITDFSGRLLKQFELHPGTTILDASFLRQGIYLLQFANGQSGKLIKQ